MSDDARNSLIAWGSVLALCALFLLGSCFLPALPDFPPWVDKGFFALLAIGFVWDIVRTVRAARRKEAGE